jgi:hypothetical protein
VVLFTTYASPDFLIATNATSKQERGLGRESRMNYGVSKTSAARLSASRVSSSRSPVSDRNNRNIETEVPSTGPAVGARSASGLPVAVRPAGDGGVGTKVVERRLR